MTTLLLTLAIVFLCDRSAKTLAFRRLGLGRSWSLAGLVTIRPAHHLHPRPWPQGSSVEWSSVWAMGLAASLGLAQLAPFDTLPGLVGLGAALGGSLGNLVDRVRHGAVLDFLRLANSPLFNPADVALACGLALVLGLGCLEVFTLRAGTYTEELSAHDLTAFSLALGAAEDDVLTSIVCLEPPSNSREQVLP